MNEERCTLLMKINKKMLFASTVALSVFPLITATLKRNHKIGQLEQLIKSKLILLVSENQQTYTVQYGDTLGTIGKDLT